MAGLVAIVLSILVAETTMLMVPFGAKEKVIVVSVCNPSNPIVLNRLPTKAVKTITYVQRK